MNTQIVPTNPASPFDAIMRTDDFGNEYWSARELMPMAGYGDKWQNFRSAIDRAAVSAMNQGHDAEILFTAVSNKTSGRPQEDFHVSRFGCYLIFQNGDPRKTEIADAQGYFAAKTREAEIGLPAVAPAELSRMQILTLALEAEQQNLALTAKIEADAPKVNFWDQYCSDDDKISFRTMASVLKVGEHDLREGLIFAGWIYGESRSRWSDTKQKKIERNRYSAMAHKKHLFDAVQNADVPRFGGELMHTLKANLAGAEAVGRWVEKIVAEFGTLKVALPVLEQRYNDRKKKVS